MPNIAWYLQTALSILSPRGLLLVYFFHPFILPQKMKILIPNYYHLLKKNQHICFLRVNVVDLLQPGEKTQHQRNFHILKLWIWIYHEWVVVHIVGQNIISSKRYLILYLRLPNRYFLLSDLGVSNPKLINWIYLVRI